MSPRNWIRRRARPASSSPIRLWRGRWTTSSAGSTRGRPGAGFLGAAVARQLLGAGEGVVILDTFDDAGDGHALKEERLASFGRHPRVSVARGDGTDAELLEAVFAEHRPASVVNAMRLPLDAAGLGPLVEASRQAGVGLLVHLSDAALYGPRAGARTRRRA